MPVLESQLDPRDATFTATCEGDPSFNGFYGHGAVDAYAAVTRGSQYLK